MKNFLGLLAFVFTAVATPAMAAVSAETPAKPANKKDITFEDLLVQGKYHFSDEAVTTVEEDKILDALLGVRKDFQDRIKQSANRF